jgi:HTH-type transcriptional regulator/antitoxin HigA
MAASNFSGILPLYFFCLFKIRTKDTRISEERVVELHKFFKISSLGVLGKKDFLVACKTAVQNVTEKNIVSSNAWSQTALNRAEKVNCKPFNLLTLGDAFEDNILKM